MWEGGGHLERNERFVSYESGHYVLVGEYGMGRYVLSAGDVVELYTRDRFQPVRVEHGGYRGWYYVTADGQQARFALGMKARLIASH